MVEKIVGGCGLTCLCMRENANGLSEREMGLNVDIASWKRESPALVVIR